MAAVVLLTPGGKGGTFGGSGTFSSGSGAFASSGAFADATLTPFAMLNPYGATSTADIAVYMSNGTSTIDTFKVGTSTTAFLAPSTSLINAVTLATSSKYVWASGYSSTGVRVIVGPSEYVVGQVTSALSGGVLGNNNTFSGNYSIKWSSF